ncbi:MAG: tRNA (adenosine(37)-N6)-threonylcarbamoyltransferase complex transferase subunit TsaD [Candidatus Saccharimonadales bacterium]|nr:tRNA (adenosine(37)-N6)-threonylcarbamoyltransferase complex transferase subunit TsaD [Candidatus Saccharimonadales bacterium]
MKILGIETSCDETAAAVVESAGERRLELLSNVVASQIDVHKVFGGVVPEVAARNHIEVMNPVIQEALDKASCNWSDIDAIGVTKGPGLSGSLLIGALAARTLAFAKKKPLFGVNHVLAHAYVNFLLDPPPQFPILALIVSGGHSQLVLFEDHLKYRILGQTQDDAVGEAYDKVAKIIGLPYPGGPSIEAKAKQGDSEKYRFPKAKMTGKYDFSFSGLKTAVLRKAQEITGQDYNFPSFELSELLNDTQVADIAASFQKTAIDTLVDKAVMAFEEFAPKSVIIGGGVAANQALRGVLAERLPIEINYAAMNLCTDNAAMIATLAYYEAQARQPDDAMVLEINPSLSM